MCQLTKKDKQQIRNALLLAIDYEEASIDAYTHPLYGVHFSNKQTVKNLNGHIKVIKRLYDKLEK